MGKPMAAVINRAGLGDDKLQGFCRDKGIPILAELPFSRAVAEAYSRGQVVAAASPELRLAFMELAARTRELFTADQPGTKEAAHA